MSEKPDFNKSTNHTNESAGVNINLSNNKESLEQLFHQKVNFTSITILKEISLVFNCISEMSNINVSTNWDHIAAFKNAHNYLGLAVLQNSVKINKRIESVIPGIKRIHTLYFNKDNPKKYHKYILISYQDYAK